MQEFSQTIKFQGKADFDDIVKQLEKLRTEATGKGSQKDLLGLDKELKKIQDLSNSLQKAIADGFKSPKEFEAFEKQYKDFFKNAENFADAFKDISLGSLRKNFEQAEKKLRESKEQYEEILKVNRQNIQVELRSAGVKSQYVQQISRGLKQVQSIKLTEEKITKDLEDQVQKAENDLATKKETLKTVEAQLEAQKELSRVAKENAESARAKGKENLVDYSLFRGKRGELSKTAQAGINTAYNFALGLVGSSTEREIYKNFIKSDNSEEAFSKVWDLFLNKLNNVAGIATPNQGELGAIRERLWTTLSTIAETEKQSLQIQSEIAKSNAGDNSLTKQYSAAKSAVDAAQRSYNTISSEYESVTTALNSEKYTQSVNEIAKAKARLITSQMALNKAYEESEEADLGDTYREVVPEINAAAQAVDQMALNTEEVVKSQTAIDSSFDRLKSRIAMVFSLGTAYNSVRRVINQTFSDVTNIDKAFTEIAMVTSYSVQQMWGTYDQYAEIANELGQTTESVIRASSLYYQQGLQTNEAIQLATDTMKLATLAGLDFEQATSLMTAALRGFHMEMNQGAHVTDVYSELAAKAAASVNDIAQAMSRTASIANSAGMSFENTSAMLTTMIEATQESPENLGTAMKTIIARFTELKENVSATESEFDDLDYNKVDKALKSIGVSLKDANGQFRNIDEVLLETAEKWNTLDRNSQRYIATISAGSRQQSRFIALMENYERTMELVNVAQDSAGRSSEQFAKYQDSIENKVNRLKNTWEQLRLSFLSSDFYKNVLDQFNKLLSNIGQLDGNQLAIFAILGATIGKTLVKNILDTVQEGLANSTKAFSRITAQGRESINARSKASQLDKKKSEIASELINTEIEISKSVEEQKKFNQEIEKTKEQLKSSNEKIDQANKGINDAEQNLVEVGKIIGSNAEMNEHVTEQMWTKAVDIKNEEQQKLNIAQEENQVLQEQLNKQQQSVYLAEQKKNKEEQHKTQLEQENRILDEQIAKNNKLLLSSQLKQSLSNSISAAITTGTMAFIGGEDFEHVIKTAGTTLGVTLIPQLISNIVPSIIDKIADKGIVKTIIKTVTTGIGLKAVIAVAAVAVASLIAKSLNEAVDKQYQKELKESKALVETKAQNLKNAEETAQKTREEASTLEDIQKKYKELSTIRYKTTEQQEEYNQLLEQIANDYPELVKVVNQETGEYEVQNQLLDEKLEKIKQLKESQESAVMGASIATAVAERDYRQNAREADRRVYIEDAQAQRDIAQSNFLGNATQALGADIIPAEQILEYFEKGYNNFAEIYGASTANKILEKVDYSLWVAYKEELSNIDEELQTNISNLESEADIQKDYQDSVLEARKTYIKNVTSGFSDAAVEAIARSIGIDSSELSPDEFEDALKDDEKLPGLKKLILKGGNLSPAEIETSIASKDYETLYKAYELGFYGASDELKQALKDTSEQDLKAFDEYIDNLSSLTYEEINKYVNGKDFGVNNNALSDYLVSETTKAKDTIEEAFTKNGSFVQLLGLDKTTVSIEDIQGINNALQPLIDAYGENAATTYATGFKKIISTFGVETEDIAKVFNLFDFADVSLDSIDQWKTEVGNALTEMGYDAEPLVEQITELASQAGLFVDYFGSESAAAGYAESIQARVAKVNESWDFFSQAFATNTGTFTGTIDSISSLEQFMTNMAELGITGLGSPEDYYEIDKTTGEVVFNAEKLQEVYKAQTLQILDQKEALKQNTLELKRQKEQRLAELQQYKKDIENGKYDNFSEKYRTAWLENIEKESTTLETEIENLDFDFKDLDSTIGTLRGTVNGLIDSANNIDIKVQNLSSSLGNLTSAFKSAYSEMSESGHISASTIESLDTALSSINNQLTNFQGKKDLINFLYETDNGIQLNTASLEEYIFAALAAAESDKELSQAKQILYYQLLAEVQAFRDTSNEIHQQSLEEINKLQEDLNSKLEAEAQARETLAEKIKAQAEAERKLYEAQYGTANHKNKLDSLYNYQTYLQQSQDAQNRAQDAISRGENIPANLRAYMEAAHQEIVNYEAQNQLIQQHIANQRAVLDSRLAEELRKLRDSGAADMSINVSDFYKEINGRWVIDFEKLNAANIPDEISDYIESVVEDMNNYARTIEQNIDAIKKKEQELKEFQSKARQDYLNVVNKVAEVLKAKYEEEIKDVQDKYTAIKEADQDYLDALEDAVNKQRELRSRASQWDDLAKQEKKLSLKMRDTSGANAKEIQKLEEETQKKREDLLDKTVDDIIQNLKELYDEQQETREAEIEYREAVLENKNLIEEATAIVENWESVEDAKAFFLEMDEEYINASGATLEQLLEDVENYYNEVQLYQEARLMDIEDFTQATTDEIVQLSESTSETLTSEADRAMREVTTSVNETIQAARDAVVQAINDVASAQEALRQAIANTAQAYRDLAEAQAAAGGGGGSTIPSPSSDTSNNSQFQRNYHIDTNTTAGDQEFRGTLESLKQNGYHGYYNYRQGDIYVTDSIEEAQRYINSKSPQERNNWTAFAEGGLVPFTGPAWVDGTPDRPEAFLNPEDTRNIGNLIDVLRSLNFNSLISSMQTAFTPSVGDTHMEININIENVASDYDVDQAVERVRQDIIDISTAAGSTVILHK